MMQFSDILFTEIKSRWFDNIQNNGTHAMFCHHITTVNSLAAVMYIVACSVTPTTPTFSPAMLKTALGLIRPASPDARGHVDVTAEDGEAQGGDEGSQGLGALQELTVTQRL